MENTKSSVPLLLFILFIVVVFVLAGGGIWWYYNKQKTDKEAVAAASAADTSNTETTTTTTTSAAESTDSSEPELTPEQAAVQEIKTWSAGTCQASGAINPTAATMCTDGATETGVTWNWGVDPQSQYCKKVCKGYIVTASSSSLPDIVLKQTIKSGTQNTAGVHGMPSKWHQGDVTFNVMPIDAKGKNIMLYPVAFYVTQAQQNQSCKTAGVKSDFPVPLWNENKNLIGVNVHKLAGVPNRMFGRVFTKTDRDGAGAFLPANLLGEGGPFVVVPKGGALQWECEGHLAGTQSWNADMTYDYMMKGGWTGDDKKGAGKNNYKVTITSHCYSGNAKDGGDNRYLPGWPLETPS